MPHAAIPHRETYGALQLTEDRRRSPRTPVPDLFVALEMSDASPVPVSGHVSDRRRRPSWTSSAIDISTEGLALTLPEEVPVGSEVLLTFRLDEDFAFVRVPSRVVRKQEGFGVGAVSFASWPDSDRLALLSYLNRLGRP
jgi:hypothetical protein